jgi:predicted RNA-binding Zn ribbon-like protein
MSATDLICDFVNTRELLEGTEALRTPAELAEWLAANGLGPAEVRATAADLREATELREALRQALLAHNDVPVDEAAAYGVLDRVARQARVRLRFEQRAGALEPEADGVSAALGRIAIAVQESMAEGSWPLLKACRASDCEWAFLDTAKNHSRAWCSMSSCGNREKARAFRERRRQRSSSSSK